MKKYSWKYGSFNSTHYDSYTQIYLHTVHSRLFNLPLGWPMTNKKIAKVFLAGYLLAEFWRKSKRWGKVQHQKIYLFRFEKELSDRHYKRNTVIIVHITTKCRPSRFISNFAHMWHIIEAVDLEIHIMPFILFQPICPKFKLLKVYKKHLKIFLTKCTQTSFF